MTDSEYSVEDLLPYDAITHIRKRWKMFFHVDRIHSSSALLDRLAQDPKYLGAENVSSMRLNDWFIVHSTLDWIPDKRNTGSSEPNDAFTEVTPFLVDGQNSFHYITYIAALATNLISIAADRNRFVVGSVPCDAPIWDIARPTATARTVAYTIDERKYWG